MVGTNTAAIDDPRLTVRDWKGRNPLRLVIDMKGRLPVSLKLFDGSAPTLVFTARAKKNHNNVDFVVVPPEREVLLWILEYLHSIDIQSIIIEGGAGLLSSFIEKDLWDEARVFSVKKEFGNGLKAPVIQQVPVNEVPVSSGKLKVYRKK